MDDKGKLFLRLTVAILMAFHGISKLRHGVTWMAGPLGAHHLPAWLAYGVYVAEVVAPILLIAGIFTRAAALVIAFEMTMAMYLVLGMKVFELDRQTGALRGELQLFYFFTAVAIAVLGSGRFALSKGRGRWD